MQDVLSGAETRYPPLWPAYLAAFAEKRLGSETTQFHLASADLKREIELFKPHLVAIGSDSRNFNRAIECARAIKQHNIPTLVGGVHISSLPESLTPDMRVACIGEGEETFTEILSHFLEHGGLIPRQLSDIKGIVYCENGEQVRTAPRPFIRTFDEIPHPKRTLVGYPRRNYVLTSRGCPYNCVFCCGSTFWGKPRYASPNYVLQEIHELADNGTKIIRIEDDTFTTNQKRLRQIVSLVTADGLHKQVQFSCWARANEVTAEVADLLKSMNTKCVWMGLESGSQRILDYLKGHVTVEQNENAINHFKNTGIQVNGFFVIGSPDETEQEMMQTYTFIRNSRLDFVTVNILTPLPGTAVWEHWINRNPDFGSMDWGKLFSMSNDPSSVVFLSETISLPHFYRLHKRFLLLSRSMKRRAHLKNLRFSELPRVVNELLIGLGLRFRRLKARMAANR